MLFMIFWDLFFIHIAFYFISLWITFFLTWIVEDLLYVIKILAKIFALVDLSIDLFLERRIYFLKESALEDVLPGRLN